MKKISWLLFFWIGGIVAQNMLATVQFDIKRLGGSANPQFFQTLAKKMETVLNQTPFSADVFAPDERIVSSWLFVVTIADLEHGIFSGYLQINSYRPVFQTDYMTTVLRIDDPVFSFNYFESDFLEYQSSSTNTNLVGLLAYYSYLILGYDYDSFGLLGGDFAFQRALEIFRIYQYTGQRGWETNSYRERYIAQYATGLHLQLRKQNYYYHRFGLDWILEDQTKAQQQVASIFQQLKQAVQSLGTSDLITSFLQPKEDEIVALFQTADRSLREEVYGYLSFLTPTRANRYNPLVK